MQAIPSALQTRFEGHLRSKAIPDPLLWSYRKWLRYYLCASPSGSDPAKLSLFKKICPKRKHFEALNPLS
jgi:hypothetical protein